MKLQERRGGLAPGLRRELVCLRASVVAEVVLRACRQLSLKLTSPACRNVANLPPNPREGPIHQLGKWPSENRVPGKHPRSPTSRFSVPFGNDAGPGVENPAPHDSRVDKSLHVDGSRWIYA